MWHGLSLLPKLDTTIVSTVTLTSGILHVQSFMGCLRSFVSVVRLQILCHFFLKMVSLRAQCSGVLGSPRAILFLCASDKEAETDRETVLPHTCEPVSLTGVT